ncbi:cyclopentanone 1, 2-monooxygenase [Colletotrichum karsti]|uniref:Cyclopentanone 1, 2-monooxygenase n=1 Tax=Colletotrichum karsti TaxID=1095194 RepID=A0A9P6HU11_9PEZI|nr:cyclopentanone 1, 2-monooxygenase [Colletotrichum karsti]KAF9871133.1 cyclopentanone 1, 2-monooxygenase [Colletotrichum karsti]
MGSIDHLDKSRLNGGARNGHGVHISDAVMDYEALIIGGGFGGVYALHQLRKHGFRAHVLEAGAALGGVWHWNSYPGARVDSEAPYYQFSVKEVWKDWTWSQRFPSHDEIKRYFNHVDQVLDISKDVSYNTVVVGADFDEAEGLWRVQTAGGRTITARFLIPATGSSHKRYEPNFENMEAFSGTVVHSASWPEEEIDFRSKRVAVIGAGATGVQLVQEIAKKQGVELTVYIRNPNIALPMRQRDVTELEQAASKSVYGLLFKAARDSVFGIPCDGTTKAAMQTAAEERLAYWEELWQRGAFNFQAGNYVDFLVDERANRMMYEFWAGKTGPRVRDPEKRAVVVPEEPPYPFATKRSSLEQDYYECLDRDNVKVVNLKGNPIRGFTPRGIVTEDGTEREHDIIVLATGYDNCTGSLTSMGLRGKDGIDMKERWKKGVWTYLGLMVRGCPNMFMIYGPQAPTALTNAPPFIEQQVEFIAEFMAKLRKEGVKSIEPRQSATEQWKELIMAMNDATLFVKNDSSWYLGANIPGKPREQLNYLGGIPPYIKACREGTSDWTKFDVTRTDDTVDAGVEGIVPMRQTGVGRELC